MEQIAKFDNWCRTRLTKCIGRRIRSFFETTSFALNGLDKKLEPFLKPQNGFFIEVGANDGISQTNTLYFEKYKGWGGLLIEAIPALADKCRENRPECIVENCALVASDYPMKTVTMNYCNLMSVVKGGMRSGEEEKRHLRSGMACLSENEHMYTVDVPAKTLSDVLDKHEIRYVDLLSLDVEGYEAEVLKGLDLERHCPEFMLIEARYRDDIDKVIGGYYTAIAVLNISTTHSDILYLRKR